MKTGQLLQYWTSKIRDEINLTHFLLASITIIISIKRACETKIMHQKSNYNALIKLYLISNQSSEPITYIQS